MVIATNHWSVSIGSTTWPVRAQIGSISLCCLISQQAVALQVGDDRLARVEAVQALVGGRPVLVDLRVEREDRDQRQVVALRAGVVVEVVRAGDLDAAGAESAVDEVVGNDRNAPVAQRQVDVLPTRCA